MRLATIMHVNSALPLLCYHHLEELIQHDDERVVQKRLAYLRDLPAVAWIEPADGHAGLGTIVDIMAAEARTAARDQAACADDVVCRTRPGLIRRGNGIEALRPYEDIWPMLADLARRKAQDNRAMIALTSARLSPLPRMRWSQLQGSLLRSSTDTQRVIGKMHSALTDDIIEHGDRRIANPSAVAASFVDKVLAHATTLFPITPNSLQEDLFSQGIEHADMADDPWLPDLIDLIEFRGKLDLIQNELGIDCRLVRAKANMRRIPTTVIGQALRRYGQRRTRTSGSDLYDRYLTCLAPYADIVFVDKRTFEDVRRTLHAEPSFAGLLQSVTRVVNYGKIAALLEQRRNSAG